MNPLLGPLLDRLGLGPGDGFPRIVSTYHRRSVVIKHREPSDTFLSLKGVGWVHGPPWTCPSPKDDELYFGLMDCSAALRELAVSRWFEGNNVPSSRVRALHKLTPSELALLGVYSPPVFRSGRLVDPVVLVTEVKAMHRVCDYVPRNHGHWLAEFKRFNCDRSGKNLSIDHGLKVFAQHLAESINYYQSLGAVNDSLSPDNVTIAGEVTDYEWIYVPGVPLPDGWTDSMILERQMKEAFYYVDVILSLCEGLSTSLSIIEVANLARQVIPDSDTGFSRGIDNLLA